METPDNQEIKTPKKLNKRDILKAGVAGTATIVTLKSRPVLANGMCNISGHLSGNLSQPAQSCAQFETMKEPIFWLTHPGAWPTEVILELSCSQLIPETGRLISGTFTTMATLNQLLPNTIEFPGSLISYLEGTDELAKQIVAAVLSYLHPNVDFRTSPENIRGYLDYVDQSPLDNVTEERLTQLLADLGDDTGDADDVNLVINQSCTTSITSKIFNYWNP